MASLLSHGYVPSFRNRYIGLKYPVPITCSILHLYLHLRMALQRWIPFPKGQENVFDLLVCRYVELIFLHFSKSLRIDDYFGGGASNFVLLMSHKIVHVVFVERKKPFHSQVSRDFDLPEKIYLNTYRNILRRFNVNI